MMSTRMKSSIDPPPKLPEHTMPTDESFVRMNKHTIRPTTDLLGETNECMKTENDHLSMLTNFQQYLAPYLYLDEIQLHIPTTSRPSYANRLKKKQFVKVQTFSVIDRQIIG